MNRIDRLTAMIIFLQGRHRVNMDEISERYDVSERTVYRDLHALQEAGVPIGCEPGEGYYIVKGYHLPPVSFDKDEAAALLAGERVMQKWNDTLLSTSYLSALEKIRAVLRPDDKEYLDTLDRHIQAFNLNDGHKTATSPIAFGFLQNAIFQKQVISLRYHTPYKDELTNRDVEPLGLYLMGNYWYLAAWCRLRDDYRMFRIDRITEYKNTKEKLPELNDHTLKEFYDQSLHKERELHPAIVRFDKNIIRYIGDQKYYHGWISETIVENGFEMTFLCSSYEYFSRWLLMWGGSFEVIEPIQIKKRVKELSEELFKSHH